LINASTILKLPPVLLPFALLLREKFLNALHCCPGHDFQVPAKARRVDTLTQGFNPGFEIFRFELFLAKMAPEGVGPATSIIDNEGERWPDGFSQLMGRLPRSEFQKCETRYRGD
jgi:hypothetical protein